MAKITIMGDALIVTSDLKLSDYELVQKYRPQALELTEGEGKDAEKLFRVSVGNVGSINRLGATWSGEARDGSGKACITLSVCPCATDVTEWVSDTYGTALMYINQLEAKLPAVVDSIKGEKAKIKESIVVA